MEEEERRLKTWRIVELELTVQAVGISWVVCVFHLIGQRKETEMVQLGDYQYGYVMNHGLDVDMEHCAIYHKGQMICSFPKEVGEDLARYMMSWHGLSAMNNLSDNELISELRERGYSGKLTLTKEIEV